MSKNHFKLNLEKIRVAVIFFTLFFVGFFTATVILSYPYFHQLWFQAYYGVSSPQELSNILGAPIRNINILAQQGHFIITSSLFVTILPLTKFWKKSRIGKTFIILIAVLAFLTALPSGIQVSKVQAQTPTYTIDPAGLLHHAWGYLIYKSGSDVYAINGDTCVVDYGGSLDNGGVDGANASAVIQQAINALPSDGGKIFFKAGIYSITQTIIGRLNLVIEGEGRGETRGESAEYSITVLEWAGSAGEAIIKFPATDEAYKCHEIRNIVLDGKGVAGIGVWIECDGDSIYNSAKGLFYENVLIRNCTDYGFLATSTTGRTTYLVIDSHFIDVYVRDCNVGFKGLFQESVLERVTVSGAHIGVEIGYKAGITFFGFIGFENDYHVYINTTGASDPYIYAIRFYNGWFDTATQTNFASEETVDAGPILFSGCVFKASTDAYALLDLSNLNCPVIFEGCRTFHSDSKNIITSTGPDAYVISAGWESIDGGESVTYSGSGKVIHISKFEREKEIVIRTNGGWTEVVNGSASVSQTPFYLLVNTGSTANSASTAYCPVFGLSGSGETWNAINFSKRLEWSFIITRVTYNTQTQAYIQLKQSNSMGALSDVGVGLMINSSSHLYGESYGSTRQLVDLNAYARETTIRVKIVVVPNTKVEFWINGALIGTITGDGVPTGTISPAYVVVSIKNGDTSLKTEMYVGNIRFVQDWD